MEDDYQVDENGYFEDYTGYSYLAPVEREPLKWHEKAAYARGGKLALLRGDIEGGTADSIKDELMNSGMSPTAEEVLAEDKKESDMLKTVVASQLEDKEVAPEVLRERLDEEDDLDDKLVESAIALDSYGKVPSVFNPDDKSAEEILGKEAKLRAAILSTADGMKDEINLDLDTASDLVISTITPGHFGLAVARLQANVEDRFNVDFGYAPKAMIFGGDSIKAMSAWVMEQDQGTQLEFFDFVMEQMDDEEVSGLFDENSFNKYQILEGLLATAKGKYQADEGDIDSQRLMNNLLTVLDAAMIGTAIKNIAIIRGAAKIKGNGWDYGIPEGMPIPGKPAPKGPAPKPSDSKEVNVFVPDPINPTSVAATVNRTNPQAGAQNVANGIIDPTGKAPLYSGATQEEFVASILPRSVVNDTLPPYGNVAVEGEMYTVLRNQAHDILNNKGVSLPVLLSEPEKWNNVAVWKNQTEGWMGYSLWANGSTVDIGGFSVGGGGTYMTANARYGKTPTKTFSKTDLPKAKKDFGNMYPGKDVTLVKKEYDGSFTNLGKLKDIDFGKMPDSPLPTSHLLDSPIDSVRDVERILEDSKLMRDKYESKTDIATIDKNIAKYQQYLDSPSAATQRNLDGEGEYLVELNITRDFVAKDAALFNLEEVSHTHAMSTWTADISTNLPLHVSNASYVAHDVSERIHRLMTDLLKPLTHSKKNIKIAAMNLLTRGRDEEITFSNFDIQSMYPRETPTDLEAIQLAYFSGRQYHDLAWSVFNQKVKADLDAENMVHLKNGDIDYIATVESDGVAKNWTVFYNPETKLIEKANKQIIEEKLLNGASFFRSKTLINGSTDTAGVTNQTTNILVEGNTVVAPLPDNVLSYIEGYMAKTYTDDIIIKVANKRTRVNGTLTPVDQMYRQAIETAPNKEVAIARVKELQDMNPDWDEISWHYTRDIEVDSLKQGMFETEVTQGGVFFGRRGDTPLASSVSIDGKAPTGDPVESILRVASKVASLKGTDIASNLQKQRFMYAARDLLPNQGMDGYPNSHLLIQNRSNKGEDVRRVNQARALHKQLAVIDTSNALDQKWDGYNLKLAEIVRGVPKVGGASADIIRKFNKRNPLSYYKSLTFTTMLVFNPTRQLYVQSQGFLFLGGIDPVFMASGQATRQAMSLFVGQLWKSDKTRPTEWLAQAAGLSIKDYEDMRKLFKDSGLWDAVDTHVMSKDALLEAQYGITKNIKGEVARKMSNYTKILINGVRDAGFSYGELINIAHTMVVARRRFVRQQSLEANPISPSSPKGIYEIHAATRQLSLGMTQAGALGYQQGMFSGTMQFASIQHKAVMAIAPAIGEKGVKYGNKAINPDEARRILLGQILLHGGASLGISAAVLAIIDEFELDVPDIAIDAIEGGAYDIFVNTVGSALPGGDINVVAGRNTAPLVGLEDTIGRIIVDGLVGDQGMLEILAGPGSTTMSRIGAVMSWMKTIYQTKMLGKDVTPLQLKTGMHTLFSLASGYNNYFKASMMRRTTDETGRMLQLSRKGQPIGSTTNSKEVFLGALLGIQPRAVQTTYELYADIKKYDEAMDEIAEKFYNNISNEFALQRTDDPVHDVVNLYNQAFIKHAELLTYGLDKRDHATVLERFNILTKRQHMTTEGNILENQVVQAAMNNSLGSALPDIIRKLERAKMFTGDEGGKKKAQMVKDIAKLQEELYKKPKGVEE